MSVFGREWECFSRVNASVAASGLLARRQHLVACIRPRERVDVPFSWHTVRVRVPLPVNLFRATRTFFHLAIFTRLTRLLPVVYTGVCIVVSDVNRCLASTHTNRASRCSIHLSSRTNWMAIVQVSLSIPLWHFVPEQLRSLFSMNYIWRNICQLDEEYRACSMPWHKRQISTIVFWPFHRFFSQLSTRGLFLPAIPVDVHLLFAEVSHSPLRSGIVHTRTCAACSPRASVYVQVRASVSRIRGCVSDRVIDTRANTHTYTPTHTHTHTLPWRTLVWADALRLWIRDMYGETRTRVSRACIFDRVDTNGATIYSSREYERASVRRVTRERNQSSVLRKRLTPRDFQWKRFEVFRADKFSTVRPGSRNGFRVRSAKAARAHRKVPISKWENSVDPTFPAATFALWSNIFATKHS